MQKSLNIAQMPHYCKTLVRRSVLFHDDCFNILSSIENESVDLIICDLPYGTTNLKWDSILPLENLWFEYKRVIKKNGAIILFGSQPFTSKLILSNLSMFKYEIIWEKTMPTGMAQASYMPMKYHENILVFYKNKPTYNKIMAKRNPNWDRAKYKMQGSSHKSNHVNIGKQEAKQYDPELVNPKSVVKFGSVPNSNGKLHPTQKPLSLLEYLVATYSNENDIVLDNCMGSNTTGLACQRLNRQFIGIEKEKAYYDISVKRLSETLF